jgi:glycosyl hydrolase family 26
MIRRSVLAVALVAAAVIAAAGAWLTVRHSATPSANPSLQGSPSPSATNTARAQPSSRRPTGPLIGVFTPGVLTSWKPEQAFGTLIGTQIRLGLAYTKQGSGFPYRFAQAAWAHGGEAVIQIQPNTQPLRAIAAGRYDLWIRTYASEVRAFGHPVVIGFAHEMNGGWYPWGKQPGAFVAAWRHIVTLFRQQGAANVTWLWTPNSAGKNPSSLRRYWPGGKYVNWVGIDGYYYDPADRFRQIFGPSIRVIRKLTRAPILLSETAVGTLAGQARLIPDLCAGIRHYHLLGLIWFDVHQRDPPIHQDWQLDGHPAAIAAFRRGLQTLTAHSGRQSSR